MATLTEVAEGLSKEMALDRYLRKTAPARKWPILWCIDKYWLFHFRERKKGRINRVEVDPQQKASWHLDLFLKPLIFVPCLKVVMAFLRIIMHSLMLPFFYHRLIRLIFLDNVRTLLDYSHAFYVYMYSSYATGVICILVSFIDKILVNLVYS